MNVEYTGRHYEVTTAIRKEVETGLTKIRKILSDKFETKVILAVEKHRHKAEITINPRNGPLVGLAQAKDMSIAVNQAIDHLEKQAIKEAHFKDRDVFVFRDPKGKVMVLHRAKDGKMQLIEVP